MKKRFLSYSIALVLVGWGFVDAKAQQPLKVGANPTNINRTAVLDVEATNKGALLPRVALTSLTDVTTIANPANALTVFNTATDGTAPDHVTPGYYYYSTAINKWVRLLSQGDAISTTSQNIYNTDGTLTGNRTINVGSNSLNFLSNASGNNVLWNLGRTATEMDMGVAGSSGAGLAGTVAGDGWMSSKNNLFVGAQGTGSFNVVTGASPTWGTRLSINSTGNMGVGTTSPTERLHISGNIRFSGALMPNNAAGTTGQVLTSAGAGAPPTWTTPTTSQNIYNTDGTLTGNRTITMGSNSLNFRSNATSSLVLWSLGRTAMEMEMGVAASVGDGLVGTIAGDSFLGSNGNMFIGARGTSSFNIVTGASPSWGTRLFINSAGRVGIGTTSPVQSLEVAGTIRASAYTSGSTLIGGADFGIYNQDAAGAWTRYTVQGGSHAFFTDGASGNGFYGSTAAMLLTSNGNLSIGIGNNAASERLHVGGNIRFSGALMPNNAAGTAGQVLTSAGAGAAPTWTSLSSVNTPNIYTQDGTLTADRTINANGNTLLLFSGSANILSRFGFGRTANEMDMGVSAGSNEGIAGTAQSDGFIRALSNMFVGTQGSGSFNVVTGALGSQATRLFINSAGSVGISTTSPSQSLDVAGTIKGRNLTNGTFAVGSGDFGLYSQNNNWMRYVTAGGNHYFYNDASSSNSWSGGTPSMVLTTTNNLGVGTTTPVARIQSATNFLISTASSALVVTNWQEGTATDRGIYGDKDGVLTSYTHGGDVNMFLAKNSAAGATTPYINFRRNGTATGSITLNGTANVSYNTSSDVRLKENIVPTHLGLSAVNNIKVYDYNFKADADKTQLTGFLAQELYKVYPTAVRVGGDDPTKDPWSVDYGKLTPLLVKAIQEQQLQIEALKKEIENLKNK